MMSSSIRKEEFRIDLDHGLTLPGEVRLREDATELPILLVAHGFRGFKEWGFWPYAVNAFAEQGYYTVIFDFSRISAASSKVLDEEGKQAARTVSQELSDLHALLDLIQEKRLPLAAAADTTKVILLGHSRGGASSILAAAEREDVSAVIAWNAPANLQPQAGADPFLSEDAARNAERYHVPRKLASLQKPALIVQGTEDQVRVLEGYQALQDAAPAQSYASINGGNHTFGVDHPFAGPTPELDEALNTTLLFLRRQAGTPQSAASRQA